MKKIIFALVAALGLSSVAHASDISVTANAGAASDYRFRGVSQTNVGPEVSGGLDVVNSSGLYAGTWLSNVSSEYYAHGSSIETDLYIGYKKEIIKNVTVDVGSYNDLYARANNDGISFNTSELYVGASYKALSLKASHSLTNYFGIPNTHGTHYVTADFSQPIGPVTVIAHAARTFTNHHNDYDYYDFNAGGSYNLPKGWTLTALYYFNKDEGRGMKEYNTLNGRKLYGDNFVVSVKKSF